MSMMIHRAVARMNGKAPKAKDKEVREQKVAEETAPVEERKEKASRK